MENIPNNLGLTVIDHQLAINQIISKWCAACYELSGPHPHLIAPSHPFRDNLVVADLSRTEKTICLAVTPALKAYGISGRARLFEVVERVKQVNAERLRKAPGRAFSGSSANDPELKAHPELALDYLVAPPRMKLYMDYSARVFEVYLKYIAPEDIHPYSIDEVFMDVTNYLSTTTRKCCINSLGSMRNY